MEKGPEEVLKQHNRCGKSKQKNKDKKTTHVFLYVSEQWVRQPPETEFKDLKLKIIRCINDTSVTIEQETSECIVTCPLTDMENSNATAI